MYAPGQFYLTALLFRIFEPQLYIACLVGVVSKASIVTLGYLMLKRHLSVHAKWLPAVGAAILVLFLARMGNEAFPAFPAAALAMLALMFMERGLAQRRLALLLSAGIFTGLAACFRHDMGIYTTAALSLGAAVILKTRPGATGWRELPGMLGMYIAGISTVAAPVAAFFFWKVPAHDLYESLIHIPSAIYPGVRHLPWAGVTQMQKTLSAMALSEHPVQTFILGLREFVVYVPFLIAIPALYISARRLWLGKKSEVAANTALPFVFMASLLCLLMTLKGAVRPAPHHLAQSIVLAIPIGLLMLPFVRQSNIAGKLPLVACLSLACVPLATTDIAGYHSVRAGLKSLGAKNNFFARCEDPALPRLRCMMAYRPSDRRNVMVADFLRQQTPQDKPIYIGAGRHDKIFLNAVMMYFMSERPAATKWYELHPGVQTRAETQQHMVEEMRHTPPSVVILDTAWDRAFENNRSSQSSGMHVLDDWLGECYKEAARFETIRVLVPRTDRGAEQCGEAAFTPASVSGSTLTAASAPASLPPSEAMP